MVRLLDFGHSDNLWIFTWPHINIFSLFCINIYSSFLILQRCIFHQPQLSIRKKDLICFVIPAIYLIVLFNSEENKILHILAMLIVIAHNLPYVGIIYYKIRKHQKRIEIISSNTESINLQWLIKLSFLLFITIIITVCYELLIRLSTKCIRIL